MNSRDLYHQIKKDLMDRYVDREASSIAFLILEETYGLSRTSILSGHEISSDLVESSIQKLKSGIPVQHVIGHSEFYGLIFKVDSSVLIPRQETEELVDLIINENYKNTGKLLDIGTGSGCIAISLARNLPGFAVTAIDISDEALKVARYNAERNGTDIEFSRDDILSSNINPGVYDIIVSNPPYVRRSEQKHMAEHVILHEPELALFVLDEDPLIYYSAITKYASKSLNKNGRLYFEINEAFGKEVLHILEKAGFSKCRIIKDLQNKDRIVSGLLI